MVSKITNSKAHWCVFFVFFVLAVCSCRAFASDQSTNNTKDITTLNTIIETIDDEEKRKNFLRKLEEIKKYLEEGSDRAGTLNKKVKVDGNVTKVPATWRFLDEVQNQTDRFLKAVSSIGDNLSQIVDFPDWLFHCWMLHFYKYICVQIRIRNFKF